MKLGVARSGKVAVAAMILLIAGTPSARAQSGAARVYPDVPKQVLMTFEFVTATPAMRAKAAQETGATRRDASYKAALLRAGAKVTDAEKITTTDSIRATIHSVAILPASEKLAPEFAPGENIVAKPIINSDGTITVDCAVSRTQFESGLGPRTAETTTIRADRTLGDGKTLLIGSEYSPVADSGVDLLFLTVKWLP